MPQAKYEQLIFGEELKEVRKAILSRHFREHWRSAVWHTESSGPVKIEDMNTQHLMNTLAYLFRNKKVTVATEFMTLEAMYRGLIPINILDFVAGLSSTLILKKAKEWFNGQRPDAIPKAVRITMDDLS